VNFGHYAHPEFGYLSPAPRFRRELRVAFFAALFGAAIGVVSVIALSASDGQGNLAAATLARSTAPVSEPREGDAGVTASGSNSAYTASNHQVRSSPGFVGRSVGSEKVEANRATECEDHLSLDSQRQCSAEKLHRARLRAAGNGPDVARVPLGHPAPVENATPSPALADSVSNPSDVLDQIETMNARPAPLTEVAAAVIDHSLPGCRDGEEGWRHSLIVDDGLRHAQVLAQITCGCFAGLVWP